MKKLWLYLLIPVLSVAKAQDIRIQRFDSLFNTLYTQNLFNGNVLVAEAGKILYHQSFGYANFTTHEKLNDSSVFELASVSKQFTSAAILQLVQKGSLSLNDSLRKFFPELPYSRITVKNLLNHTGGEPDYFLLLDLYWDKTKIIDNKALIKLMAAHPQPVDFEPGEKWKYSNTGYMLLASIIEKVSGMSYAAYLEKNIFHPLGMKNTFVYTRRFKPAIVPNYAFGYVFNDSLKQWVLPDSLPKMDVVFYADGIVGDGCVNSTTLDLLKWDRALYNNEIVCKELLDEAFTPTVLNSGAKQNYGYGWSTYSNEWAGKVVSHSGGWPGYMTWIFRNIDKDKTIIILCNKMLPLKGLTQAAEKILFYKPYDFPFKR